MSEALAGPARAPWLPRRGGLRGALASLLCLSLAGRADAAGLGIPDLGAEALAEGGAQVAGASNLSALWYNPAGLASLDGVVIALDSRLILHRVGFQRLGADGSNPLGYERVQNAASLPITTMAPLGGIAVRWNGGPVPLVFAAGGFPFTGATGYDYPDPGKIRAGGGTAAQITQQAPQRYASIFSGSKVYVAALAVAARVFPWLDAGAELQLANASFSSRQSVASGVVPGESPDLDADLLLQGSDLARPSAAFGLTARLPAGLVLGLSGQLPYRFHADGTLTADIPPTLAALGAKIEGQNARFHVTLPWYLRAGLRLIRPVYEVELAGTLDGWSTFDQIRIVPENMTVTVAGQTTQLPELVLRKDLTNAFSARLGGALHLGELWPALAGLSARAGLLYESSAVPEQRQSLDLMAWARLSASVGAGFTAGPWSFSIAYAHFFQPDRQVRDSSVQQVLALPGNAPTVVGNGDYSSQLDLFAVSATLHLGG